MAYNQREYGRPITIMDEGVPITTNVESLDFTGTPVVASAVGNAVTVAISGTGGGGAEFLLLADGSSFFLLADGASKLKLSGT